MFNTNGILAQLVRLNCQDISSDFLDSNLMRLSGDVQQVVQRLVVDLQVLDPDLGRREAHELRWIMMDDMHPHRIRIRP